MLQDKFGRTINYLRLSVTDRCDFRCVYCMAEEMEFVPRQQLLTIEEMTQISQAFIELGVSKIRITGGEPLVRRNIDQLFKNLSEFKQLDELTLTTNGSQLKQHAEVLLETGVKRINISLDSLDKKLFHSLTRTGNLDQVLDGIESALNAGLKIKLNSVVLKNRNIDEVINLVDFAISRGIDISFIEEMPLGVIADHQREEEFVSSEALRKIIEEKYKLKKQATHKENAGPSNYWFIAGSQSRVGFISPHSENFCSSCNRVRLTATGQLLLCLGNEHSVDLKAIVRRYPGEQQPLSDAIVNAMTIKPERHYFELSEQPEILRFMNTTGG